MRGSAGGGQLKVCRVPGKVQSSGLDWRPEESEGWKLEERARAGRLSGGERSCPAVGEEFPVSLPAPG